jgi:hypothetical protein
MDLKIKYKENYESLGSLRHFVESGIMLASVNFWRDSFQGYQEFEIIENREEFLSANEIFFNNEFVKQFFIENFPETGKRIEMSEASSLMDLIHDNEGDETYEVFTNCILAYAVKIAKSSKEDWLSFIGLKDNISDQESIFLHNLTILLKNS